MQEQKRIQPLARDAMAYVLAGGRGSRLKELTDRRAKPAVYFGGKARIIDFALSNALNSGIRRIGVATQYKAHSLIRHLQRGWNFFRPERNESFDILPASQRVSETQWYEGTADAVYQNIDIIEDYNVEYMVILAGDHIYKMDYELMLQQHVDSGADVTIGCLEVPRMEATGFGVMHVDEKDRSSPSSRSRPIRRAFPAGRTGARLDGHLRLPHQVPDGAAAPRRQGPDVEPRFRQGHHPLHREARQRRRAPLRQVLRALHFEREAYWRDVGNDRRLLGSQYRPDRHHAGARSLRRDWPIWTFAEMKPPAKFVHDDEDRRGSAMSSLVSGDCIISGSTLHRSLLFTGCAPIPISTLEDAVMLPDCHDRPQRTSQGVVIDRGVIIPEGLVVGEDPELDAKRFRRSENGICLITQPMIDKLEQVVDRDENPFGGIRSIPADQDGRPRRRRRRIADRARRTVACRCAR
jgi:glucose-1-phosphate adenylyltransferase